MKTASDDNENNNDDDDDDNAERAKPAQFSQALFLLSTQNPQ